MKLASQIHIGPTEYFIYLLNRSVDTAVYEIGFFFGKIAEEIQ